MTYYPATILLGEHGLMFTVCVYDAGRRRDWEEYAKDFHEV